MKTKLTLFIAVIAVALFGTGCASTGEFVNEPTFTPSRNVLLNVGGGNKDFVNFRLTGSVAIIENATEGSRFSGMVGKCVPFIRENPAAHWLNVEGWYTTWIFKPDGTAEVAEGNGPAKGYAVQVRGKTLKWPEELVDAETGEKKSGPQTRSILWDIAGSGGHDLVNAKITGDKLTVIAMTSPRNNLVKPGYSPRFAEIDNEGRFELRNWTALWFCLPDGTASVKERPLSGGSGLAIPVQGDTLKWPK